MEDPLWVNILIWGTWLLVALIVDGIMVPIKLYLSRKGRRQIKNNETYEFPYVNVVVPSHNEEDHIGQCLKSIFDCDYTANNMEVIVVDDGSTDGTLKKVEKYREYAREHGKKLRIIEKGYTGKVHTLNTGLKHCKGSIIITVDSDVKLAQNAIKNIVIPFIENKNVGAATGYIEIEWDNADPHNFLETFFSKCEFLEYLSSFNFERSYQSIIDSIYTMSGAFSAFRRKVIGNVGGYWPITVAEDMHVTMMLHDKKIPIVNVPEAVAFVDSITNFDSLYSQRVRWARGQLEVASMCDEKTQSLEEEVSLRDMMSIARNQRSLKLLKEYFMEKASKKICGLKEKTFKSFGFLGLQRILFVDHTIAFPRLLWVFVLLIFPLFGLYTDVLIIVAFLMYVFYVIMDAVVIFFAYNHSSRKTQVKIERSYNYVFLLPIYRLMIFCFRISAFLQTLNEPATWKVSGPVNKLKNNIKNESKNSIITTLFKW